MGERYHSTTATSFPSETGPDSKDSKQTRCNLVHDFLWILGALTRGSIHLLLFVLEGFTFHFPSLTKSVVMGRFLPRWIFSVGLAGWTVGSSPALGRTQACMVTGNWGSIRELGKVEWWGNGSLIFAEKRCDRPVRSWLGNRYIPICHVLPCLWYHSRCA